MTHYKMPHIRCTHITTLSQSVSALVHVCQKGMLSPPRLSLPYSAYQLCDLNVISGAFFARQL
jgi:hypothetical protein